VAVVSPHVADRLTRHKFSVLMPQQHHNRERVGLRMNEGQEAFDSLYFYQK
jgi:hypothetical protein